MRRILADALPGKRTNIERRIAKAERLEAAIFERFHVSPWKWQAKHIRWFFAVHADSWSPSARYDAWREFRAVLQAVGKGHVAALLSCRPKSDYIRPSGISRIVVIIGSTRKAGDKEANSLGGKIQARAYGFDPQVDELPLAAQLQPFPSRRRSGV